MFALANALDFEYMFRSFGNLTKEQKEFCFGLSKRMVVIKNTIRFTQPVFGIIPEIPSLEEISEFEITEINNQILSNIPSIKPRYNPRKIDWNLRT